MNSNMEYENKNDKESKQLDKKVQKISKHVMRNINKGKDEMRAVPGFQVPVLHDGEFDAIQANLEQQGIGIVMSEKSHDTDDTGARLRVVSVEDQEIADKIDRRNEKIEAKEELRAQKRIDKISKYVARKVDAGVSEMPAVPGFQVPVLHDGEFDAIQANLEEQGISIAVSEKSQDTDDTGARLRAERL